MITSVAPAKLNFAPINSASNNKFAELLKNKTKNQNSPKANFLAQGYQEFNKSHQSAIKSVELALKNDIMNPNKLVKIQYKTGMFFLREQILTKATEMSANSLKNFTQLQV